MSGRDVKDAKARINTAQVAASNRPAAKQIHHANIVRHGRTLIVPETLGLLAAAEILVREAEAQDELINVSETIDAFVWDGAQALEKAMVELYGFALTQVIQTPWGPIYPKKIAVPISTTEKMNVTWGRFRWFLSDSKEDDEYIQTGTTMKDGRLVFSAGGQVRKKWEKQVSQLFDRAREIVREDSIYKAKGIKLALSDDDGEPLEMPMPEFLDLESASLDTLVYTQELTDLIETYIMTPLRHADACRAAQIPLKRGVLAAGPYGTGKSLLAQAVGKVGVENKWTFIYIERAADLPDAIALAKLYAPAVIFAEDLDRAVEGEERTEEIDNILNTLDGIDSKQDEVMVILTTNHLEQVNPAMRRPGRLDVVLNIVPPDADAVQRLIRVYGRGLVEESAELAELGQMLDGQTPAVIREVIERAKLGSIARTGKPTEKVTSADLHISARAMLQQQQLLTAKPVDERSIADRYRDDVVSRVLEPVAERLSKIEERVEAVADRFEV